MALKHWQPGKLALFWAIILFGVVALVGLGFGIELEVRDALAKEVRRSYGASGQYAFYPPLVKARAALENHTIVPAAVALFGTATVLFAAPFVVTWKWFTAREKRD